MGFTPSIFESPFVITSSKKINRSPGLTVPPAILPVSPYDFDSFLTMMHGILSLCAIVGSSNAPFSSMEANLLTFISYNIFLIS